MTAKNLSEVLELHKKWLNNDKDGRRADLSYADLSCVDLICADLRHAELRNATLIHANLRGADLSYANLRNSNLSGADLSYANLNKADLDYSCLPLWCGTLTCQMDDKQIKQLLYHILSIAKNSDNVSENLKKQLLTEQNLNIAREFHRVAECQTL